MGWWRMMFVAFCTWMGWMGWMAATRVVDETEKVGVGHRVDGQVTCTVAVVSLVDRCIPSGLISKCCRKYMRERWLLYGLLEYVSDIHEFCWVLGVRLEEGTGFDCLKLTLTCLRSRSSSVYTSSSTCTKTVRNQRGLFSLFRLSVLLPSSGEQS